MKKVIVLLLLVVTFATGCSGIVSVKSDDIDTIVKEVLLKKSSLSNVAFEGYKYYVPRGLTFINKEEFNALLQDQYHNRYYLYVDVVSYYHQVEESYKKNQDAYYSRQLKNGKDFGYLEINEVNNKYFIEAMYHYVKIEAYVSKSQLVDAVANISHILSSVQYNRSILETLVGDKVLNYQEEEFDIFKSKRKTGDFLDYVEEYGKYYDKDNELPDQDRVELEEED